MTHTHSPALPPPTGAETQTDAEIGEQFRAKCKELHQKLGRDAMLRQNDPVETITEFAWRVWQEGYAEGYHSDAYKQGYADAAPLQVEPDKRGTRCAHGILWPWQCQECDLSSELLSLRRKVEETEAERDEVRDLRTFAEASWNAEQRLRESFQRTAEEMRKALEEIAEDYKTYKGHGDYDEGAMDGREAQKIARDALTATRSLAGDKP